MINIQDMNGVGNQQKYYPLVQEHHIIIFTILIILETMELFLIFGIQYMEQIFNICSIYRKIRTKKIQINSQSVSKKIKILRKKVLELEKNTFII
jgi:hypothetical protein